MKPTFFTLFLAGSSLATQAHADFLEIGRAHV